MIYDSVNNNPAESSRNKRDACANSTTISFIVIAKELYQSPLFDWEIIRKTDWTMEETDLVCVGRRTSKGLRRNL